MTAMQHIVNAFNTSAPGYEQAAIVQKEIGQRLFDRLDYIKLKPHRILDLGCGSGYFSSQLQQKYPEAQLVSLDLSQAMLAQIPHRQKTLDSWSLTAANMDQLPFAEASFDLIFANQALHWSQNLPELFFELNRVTRPDGCLMFSTLGPDSLKEIRQAWAGLDSHAHTNPFVDMHDIGDWLLQAQWHDPVVDMSPLSVHYASVADLLRSLQAQGVKNIHPQRPAGLMGRQRWQAFCQALAEQATANGKIPLSYEVVYGQAWKGELAQRREGQDTYIPLSQLRRR